MIPPPRTRRRGVVAEYDDHAGFGQIEAEGSAGTERWWFHCTALADGSRHAEPGQPVTFQVVPGHSGRWEATEVA